MALDQQFNTVNEKVQALLKQHARLKKEAEQLKQELAEERKSHKEKNQLIEDLQQQIAILKVAAGDMPEKDKKDFERKINLYIKEIDKCISFLSQ